MAGWHPRDIAPIYGPAVTVAGTRTIDLSSIVGSNRCLAFLRITCTNSWPIVAVKTNGDPDDWVGAWSSGGKGAANGYPNGALSEAIGCIVATDANGVLQWRNVGTATLQIDLLGWIESTYSGVSVFSGVAPAVWTNVDLSAVTGAKASLVFLKSLMTGGISEAAGVRPDGDGADWLDTSVLSKGCSQGKIGAIGRAHGYVIKSSAAGIIEHNSATGGIQYDTYLEHYESTDAEFNDVSFTVFSLGFPPLAWQDLDLSVDVGANPTGLDGPALALLRVGRVAVGGGVHHVGFRQKGDTSNMQLASSNLPAGASSMSMGGGETSGILVTTDSDGVVQWQSSLAADQYQIQLIGFVPAIPPTISGESPVGAAEAPDVKVLFITDDDTGVDPSTINLDLTAPDLTVYNAIIGGVFQPGYTGTISAVGGGYWVALLTHQFFTVGSWQADAYCEDTDKLSAASSWSWTVVANPPSVIYTHPVEFTPDVDQIRFSVVDIYGLDTSSLSLSAVLTGDGEKTTHVGIIATVPQLGWDVTIVESDYTGVIPRRIDVVIRDWPMDLSVVYRRVEMVVDITSFVGVPL